MNISACIITKNEEENLPTCLDSVKSFVSEIIVVDTGSTDRTVEIAESYGAKVFSFTWIDDFAAARNFAIEQAKMDWIVFLDADEYFSPDSVKYVPLVIQEAEQQMLDMVICMMSNIEKTTRKITSSNIHVRIFKNHPQIRYIGAIHERIVRLDVPAKYLDAQKEITIIHTGYSEDTILSKEKSKRNLELLFKELERKPDSFDVLFYISDSYLLDRQFEQALEFAIKAKSYSNSELKGIYEKNYVNMIQCLIQLSKPNSVILSTIREALEAYPSYPDFHLYLGDYYKLENRYFDAIEAYQEGLKFLDHSPVVQSSAFATAANVVNTIGQMFYKRGDWNQCVNYHVQALQIDKYLYSSLVGLINILGRFEKPDSIFLFLSKIYDASSTKDCFYLLRASLETKSLQLATRLFEIMPVDVPALKEYQALFDFISEKYDKAGAIFLELYQETSQEEFAYSALAVAWKEKIHRADILRVFSSHFELQQLAMHIFEEELQFPIDKKQVFKFLMYVSSTLKISDYHVLAELVKQSKLMLEMADYLYYQEKYVDAYQFYNEYLEQGEQLPSNTLAEITYKVGDCLLQCGLDEHAWAFLQKAHSLVPEDFRVYESLVELAKRSNRLHEVKGVLEIAISKYPDSNYIRNLYERSILN
ncbi:glycosyltransferase [Brevibacillus sp. HB1.2]|uniref:glycosyltransferase family 2 protein n=1 Tax=Brevibacillus sp. HB1.2 TaxID=2738807 RepID=UPI001574F82A|nr:glycosyltransferase family 2 protein [Brevibacillus sp. HB1.2]NTU21781.1 glycosyltransferase [Brevibacillus sp. HB1.2]